MLMELREIMLKGSVTSAGSRLAPAPGRGRRSAQRAAWLRSAVAVMVAVLLLQPACLFRRKKAAIPASPPAPTRIVLLPLNVPTDSTDLRWVALAAPAQLAKSAVTSPDLEIVPLWETMPVALEAVGQSRDITAELAAYIASRLMAKWATQGELSPAKDGVALILDFIPAKASIVPFRYAGETRVDALGADYREAFQQFLRYLVARPLKKQDGSKADSGSLSDLARAIDKEYGWFADADPGKSEKLVADLSRADGKLARILFNPNLYRSLEAKPERGPAGSGVAVPVAAPAPASPPPPPRETPVPGLPAAAESAKTSQPEPAKAEPAGKEAPAAIVAAPPEEATALPPPKSFSQRIGTGQQKSPPAEARQREPQPADRAAVPSATGKEKTGSVAERAKVEPVAKASLPVAGRTYRIQIFSSRSKKEAAAKADQLAKAGFAPELDEVDLKDKGIWYRLRLQGFQSREAAIATGEKLLAQKLIKEYWVLAPQED